MQKIFVKDREFYKSVLIIGIPVILQNLITIGVNVMDTVMLGNYGEVQLSASSLANEFIMVFQILCMGMGGGAAVLTAQYWGKKELVPIKKTITIMLRICMTLALIFTLIVAAAPSTVMRLYTNESDVIAYGKTYFLVSIPTFLLMGISLTLTIILRSIRKVKLPLYTSIITFFVNIFFNWVFIFGNLGAREMQIAGAALGTLIARVVEAVIIGGYFFTIESNLKYRIRDIFMKCGDHVKLFIKFAMPVVISDGLLALGNSLVTIVIGHLGAEFVAANAIMAIMIRISTIFNNGVAQSSSVITGNTLGRGEVEKAYRQGITFTALSVFVGIFAAIVVILVSPTIIAQYNISDETIAIAHELTYAVSIMVFFQAIQSTLTKGVLRGGGDTRFLMVADALFMLIASVPLGAIAGFVWKLSPFWIYICLKVDYIIKAFWCTGRLKSKKWIKRV